MMFRSLLAVLLTSAVCAVWAAPAPPEGPKRIRLAPQSAAKPGGAFRYRLLPDPRDRIRGNAAPLWRLAGDAFLEAKHKMTNQESDWAGRTPLKNLPRNEVHDFLKHYTAPLSLARQAACREHCDWQLPPVTFQSTQIYFPQMHLQRSRELATLLRIQFRLQLLEGRFEDAAETLQTGFALARHCCEGDTFLDILIGNAFHLHFFSNVEEWMQTPGSPNLYWALTELTRPAGRMRHISELEMNSLYRSFPRLRRLGRETLTAREADSLVNEMLDCLNRGLGDNPKAADAIKKWAAAIRDEKIYSQARKYLTDLGRSDKEIDAMPKAQTILLFYVDQYDRAWNKVFEALSVPTWQARPLMEAACQEFRSTGNVFLNLLSPVFEKIWLGSVRIDRQIAGLRCAEALRLYAAAHNGQAAAKWSDITAVPLPIDSLTGKGFDSFYHVTDGRSILEIPPPPPPDNAASLGRRYELAPP